MKQAKPETVEKVSKIVKKQLALPDDSTVNGESKFSTLGADSLDTVKYFTAHVSSNLSFACLFTIFFILF